MGAGNVAPAPLICVAAPSVAPARARAAAALIANVFMNCLLILVCSASRLEIDQRMNRELLLLGLRRREVVEFGVVPVHEQRSRDAALMREPVGDAADEARARLVRGRRGSVRLHVVPA